MIQRIGQTISWLNVVLIFLIGIDVILRYVFSRTPTWIVELEWHLFALIFLIAAAWSMKEDRHVRVDLIYSKWPVRRQALFNLFGHVFFLLPWAGIVIYTSGFVARRSYLINESSPNAGGLPYLWVIKFAITLGFVFIVMQILSEIGKNLSLIKKGA